MKILVVDDRDGDLLLVGEFLHQLGHVAVPARSGLEALDKFCLDAPDLVLMDVMLAETGGREVVARMREISGERWVPIISMVNEGGHSLHGGCMALDADDCIGKPLNLVMFKARLEALARMLEARGAEHSPAQRPVGIERKSEIHAPGQWKVDLRLTAPELKEIEVVPMLLDWMDQLGLNAGHHGQLFLILGELFNNAVDHGLLYLDSSLKYQPDGFEHYLELRRERLERLEEGELEIELERIHRHEGEFLRICVKDSGKGFDYGKMLDVSIGSSTWPAGRGLALVKSLGAKIDHTAEGREVTVLYRLG